MEVPLSNDLSEGALRRAKRSAKASEDGLDEISSSIGLLEGAYLVFKASDLGRTTGFTDGLALRLSDEALFLCCGEMAPCCCWAMDADVSNSRL